MNAIINLSSKQIRHIADLKEKIDSLQHELNQVLSGAAPSQAVVSNGRRTMSAAARRRIAAAQRRRWAKVRQGAPANTAGKRKRHFSAAAKAKIAAAARERWARAKAAGRTRL